MAISFNSFMIRFRFLLPFLLLVVVVAHAKYIPDPIVRYKIDARLDPAAKTVTGHEIIVWRNHTTDAIPDLQFHLYLNAFKNSYTTFMRESHGHHRESRFRGRPNEWGYEQISSLNVDGLDLTAGMRFIQPDDGNYYDQTVLEVPLPKPIPAGASVTIEIAWTSKLPRVFARTGFQDNFFLVGQWFPKPGVYEAKGERHRAQGGWNCHQFHANTGVAAEGVSAASSDRIGSAGSQAGRDAVPGNCAGEIRGRFRGRGALGWAVSLDEVQVHGQAEGRFRADRS